MRNKLVVLILEDNDMTRLGLKKIVETCRDDTVVVDFPSRAKAYVYALENKVDLFLVDIILEPGVNRDTSGIDFAYAIRENRKYRLTPIIFITTLMGLEADLLKKIHCYDYIEKPLGDGNIVKKHINEVLTALSYEGESKCDETFSVYYDGVGYMIHVHELIYFQYTMGKLSICTVHDEIIIPHMSAKKLKEKLCGSEFLNPARGVVVNANYIASVDFRNREIYLKNSDSILPIGGRKIKEFREAYLNWNS